MRIVVADDHTVVRRALRALLTRKGLEVVAEAATGAEALTAYQQHTPDVLLLDLTMPPGADGIEVTRQLRREHPDACVVVLTMHDDEELRQGALEAGARAFVLKQAPESELWDVLQKVTRQEWDERPCPGLTERECQTLVLLAQGYGNKEAAGKLGVSVKTIESHRSSLMLKLGLNSRAELVRFALCRGLLTE